MSLIQRFFDDLGAGGILLILLVSLVSLLLVGVSNYRRSLEVCYAAFHRFCVTVPDATTPLTYSGCFWYTRVAIIDFPSQYPGIYSSLPPLSVVNLPGLRLPLDSQVLWPICKNWSRYHLPVHSLGSARSFVHVRGSVYHADLFFRCSRGLA